MFRLDIDEITFLEAIDSVESAIKQAKERSLSIISAHHFMAFIFTSESDFAKSQFPNLNNFQPGKIWIYYTDMDKCIECIEDNKMLLISHVAQSRADRNDDIIHDESKFNVQDL